MRTAKVMGLGLAMLAGGVGGARGQATPPIDFRALFLQLDANGDTVIDADEVPESARASFEKLLKHGDADKDGRLDVAELRALGQKLRALGPAGGDAGRRFKEADEDGDGKLSRDEFPGPRPVFDRIDADRDGFITPEEAAKFRNPPAAAAGPLPPRLKAMDEDDDGKVSREEFRGPKPLFDRLDADADGFIDREEAARSFQGMGARPRAKAKLKGR